MKKLKYLLFAVSFATIFSFLGCEPEENYVLEQSVSADVTGKTAYLVKYNSSATKKTPTYVLGCEGFSRSAVSVENPIEFESGLSVEEFEKKLNDAELYLNHLRTTHYKRPNLGKYEKDFVKKSLESKKKSRSALDDDPIPTHKDNFSTGAEYSFYVDIPGDDGEKYTEQEAKLRASGTYCNIWVLNYYFSDSAFGNKINSDKAKKIAEKFDSMYPLITAVFGYESDKYNNIDENALTDLSESDLGTKINIVIYDLEGDLVGYFSPKDYYYTENLTDNEDINASNCGKIFYIDSGFVNSDFDDTILTLAHEFQHMINFNMKTLKGQSPSTFYDEMLSMICEDLMQSKLNISDDDSPKNRLPLFNMSYFDSGINEYREDADDKTLTSYSVAYAFGAWITRQFGGSEIVKKIMHDGKKDLDSIVSSVNEISGKSYTQDSLIREFATSLVKNNEGEGLNKSISGTYPLSKINLYDLQNQLPKYYSNFKDTYKFDGPNFLDYGESGNKELRPYGFSIHKIGTVKEGVSSISLELNETEDNLGSVKYFIVFK